MIVIARPRAQMRVNFIAILVAAELVRELRVVRPFGMAHHFAERMPLGIVTNRDRDPLVVARTRISIVRSHEIITVGPLEARLPVHPIVAEQFMHLAYHGLTHARVDPLALAGASSMAERGQSVEDYRRCDGVVGP